MLNHICFEVKPCFTMGVATMAFHLQILMRLPETNSIRLESKTAWFITEFEVSDHKRMDILTNIGLMAMFYFVGSSNLMGLCKKTDWVLFWNPWSFWYEARRLIPGSTCWIAVPCSTWVFLPTTQFLHHIPKAFWDWFIHFPEISW